MGIDLTLAQRLVRIGHPRLYICPYFALFRTGRLNITDKLKALRNESGGFCDIKK